MQEAISFVLISPVFLPVQPPNTNKSIIAAGQNTWNTAAISQNGSYVLACGVTYNPPSYPGPQFLEKYGIGVGKVFDCYLKVIIKGTCTPMLFEFPSIRLDDYFEN